jgi:hypothetical protein
MAGKLLKPKVRANRTRVLRSDQAAWQFHRLTGKLILPGSSSENCNAPSHFGQVVELLADQQAESMSLGNFSSLIFWPWIFSYLKRENDRKLKDAILLAFETVYSK